MRRLSQRHREILNRLDRPTGGDELRHSTEPLPLDSLQLVQPATPLFAGNSTGSVTGRSAEVALRITDRDGTDPYDATENRVAISGVASNTITVSGDQTDRVAANSFVRLLGSTATGYGSRHVAAVDLVSGDTEIELSGDVPSGITHVILPGPWPLATIDEVFSAACQTAVVGMPGDDLVVARIGEELIPLGGPVTLWGILDEQLDEPTFIPGPPKQLIASSASVTVHRIDPATHEFLSTGISLTLFSVWEGLNLAAGHTVAFERYSGHWLLKPASCSPSALS